MKIYDPPAPRLRSAALVLRRPNINLAHIFEMAPQLFPVQLINLLNSLLLITLPRKWTINNGLKQMQLL